METEREVASHYSRVGLEASILDALRASGLDIERLDAADLSGADEFHLGWRPATAALAADLGLASGMQVLDIGSGIGGPARYFAQTCGCNVTGIDLTADYVDVARELTRRCGLGDRVAFQQASALAMPFRPATFDAATLIHVGMNIADKAALFAQVRRVLKPDGRFGIYDVMRMDDSPLTYPMPWAQTEATSFVERPVHYRAALAASGFVITEEHNRAPLAIELARAMAEKAEREGPPVLGLHMLMGPATKERMGNVFAALKRGQIAPTAIIARVA